MQKISRVIAVSLLVLAFCAVAQRVAAEPIELRWPQPGGPGSAVHITYSFSNLLDGTLLLLTPAELRVATEEALRLWASYAPLHFVERFDSGPPVSDLPYDPAGHPQIRIGHHPMPELAHAFPPGTWDGLAGDVHVSPAIPWSFDPQGWNFLDVITHELGHSVGVGHIDDVPAIMNAFIPHWRFAGLGTAFLMPPDIEAVQALYGAGVGSVHPIPEPATIVLVATGVALMARARRRRRQGL